MKAGTWVVLFFMAIVGAGVWYGLAGEAQAKGPAAALYTKYCLTGDTPVRVYPFDDEQQIREHLAGGTEIRLALYPTSGYFKIEYEKDGQVESGYVPWGRLGECSP